MVSELILPIVLLVVGGLSGAVGVEIIRTWRDKPGTDLALFYPTWQTEMTNIRRELGELRELIVALSDELTSLGGDPTRVRVELSRQQYARLVTQQPTRDKKKE